MEISTFLINANTKSGAHNMDARLHTCCCTRTNPDKKKLIKQWHFALHTLNRIEITAKSNEFRKFSCVVPIFFEIKIHQ